LAEVEKMATHVGIINNGELLFQGSITDLESISQPQIYIEADNAVDAANLLTRNQFIINTVSVTSLTLPFTDKQQMGEINYLLNHNGITVYTINKIHKDLEELFLNITQKRKQA
jgi:ABC-2 type transport system ATP-binding protein